MPKSNIINVIWKVASVEKGLEKQARTVVGFQLFLNPQGVCWIGK